MLRSLNLLKGFQTSQDSAYYVRAEPIPVTIPSFANAALFPTKAGFDLTFGQWIQYNSTVYGKRDPPTEDMKLQYDIAGQGWTESRIIEGSGFQMDASKRVSSAMTAWIPSLRRGFLFGGNFVPVNQTIWTMATELEDHNGLITYHQDTNRWANETTPLGGISDGGLVHITTATDEVLIQFGGKSKRDIPVVCLSTY